MRTTAWLLLAATALGTGAASADRGASESFHWAGAVPVSKTVTIRGVNGAIRAEWSSGAQVVVDAEKWGRRSDPSEVKIQVEEDRDGVTICARYPHTGWGGLNDCNDLGNTRSDVQVEFTLRVPTGVRLSLETVNGSIDARDLRGPVRARTVNGAIQISTTDRADARTVNGSIDARMRPPASGRMKFVSVNGNIDLELPSDAQAEMSGFTVNGVVRSDFPVTTHAGWVGRRMSGRLGRGGATLEMATVNGSIRLTSH